MKRSTQIIHNEVANLHLDDFIAGLCQFLPGLFKFLPTNSEYPEGTIKQVIRNTIKYELDVCDYMQWYIYAGIREPLWNKAIRYIYPNSIILDIGSNVGSFALRCAAYIFKNKMNAEIHAFEPNPIIFSQLNKNIELNNILKKNIVVKKIALRDSPGTAGFNFNENNSGNGKISNEKASFTVQCTTLDKYISENRLPNISLIKIDVEGFEPLVIDGGLLTIKHNKPVMILEVTDSWYKELGSSEFILKNKLIKLGYQLFAFQSKKLKNITYYHKTFLSQYNLLAIPESYL